MSLKGKVKPEMVNILFLNLLLGLFNYYTYYEHGYLFNLIIGSLNFLVFLTGREVYK